MYAQPQFLFGIALSAALSGCAIYYRDAETGAENIWGIGHLAVKVSAPAEGKKAVISKATLMGVALGFEDDSLSISTGYDRRERATVYDESTTISIEKPESGDIFLFTFRSQPSVLTSSGQHDAN